MSESPKTVYVLYQQITVGITHYPAKILGVYSSLRAAKKASREGPRGSMHISSEQVVLNWGTDRLESGEDTN